MASAHSLLVRLSTCLVRSAMLLWLSLLLTVDAQNQSADFQTLLTFKNSAREESVSDGEVQYWSSWNETDKDPCGWFGVTCTANSTVEKLDFAGWGLVSSVDFGVLSNLKDLRELDLSANNLDAGDIPVVHSILPVFLNFAGLTRLDLSSSGLGGIIQPNVSAWRNLRYISLEHNQLDGQIPDLRGLVNLQTLLLADNQLTGPFPETLAEVTTLAKIDISSNSLSGTIPSLSNLPNLLYLNLSNNTFTGLAGPSFPGAKSLEQLVISGNKLQGTIPSGITDVPNLRVLNLSSNQLSGGIPLGFSRQISLYSIDLSQNQLRGKIPFDFNPGIVSVNLSRNLLTGHIAFNGSLTSLQLLDLSYNKLSGPLSSILNASTSSSIFYSTYMSTLVLQNNLLSGDIVDFLSSRITQGGITRLGNNLFTGDLSRVLNTYFFRGNILDLNNNDLYGGSSNILDLNNNNLHMSASNAIPDPLWVFLENLALFSELHVGGNNFSGISLPTSLNFSSPTRVPSLQLQVLDLSNNQLKGEILGASFNNTIWSYLANLNLSSNDITGSIPESLIMFPLLEVLDVTNNSLSGQLPGILPNSKLYNPSFFAGNDGLCGSPLPPCQYNLKRGLQWWILLISVAGSLMISGGTCLAATWRWRVYWRRHQQDVDLIRTLMERDSATLMSLHELKKATDNFAESAKIGEGGFGVVYLGTLSNGTRVAIKKSKHKGIETNKETVLNEVRILCQVNHRNLVRLLGCCMENKVALLVFEFISNGTLQEHLRGKFGLHLSWKQRLNIVLQTADALNYLHSAAMFPIYHRDVKSANILLDGNFNAKVADFGISRLAPVEATHVSTVAVQGTMGYIDTEYFTSYQLTDKSDVYSFGVVLLELISAKPAIDFRRGGDQTSLVTFANPFIESGDLEQLIDPTLVETYNDPIGRDSILKAGRLALQCLNMRSKARPSMKEVWIELKTLCLEFDGTTEHFNGVNKDDEEAPEHSQTLLDLGSFPNSSDSFTVQIPGNGIEMSQFSVK